jgi:riboflavin synthase
VFTGIVQGVGTVGEIAPRGAGCDLTIVHASAFAPANDPLVAGESVSLSGVCLSVVATSPHAFTANVIAETLRCTTLGALHAGDRVNLERSLRPTDRLGGHIVAGHVDGVGVIARRTIAAYGEEIEIDLPAEIARYAVHKGSIAVDGVSLTVGRAAAARCVIYLIPHTLAETIAGAYREGTRVNIEVDVIGRYVERLLQGETK